MEGSPNWEHQFPTSGQGTICYNVCQTEPFKLVVTKSNSQKYISLEITRFGASFSIQRDGETETLIEKTGAEVGYDPEHKITYWFSYDRDNLELVYGKQELRWDMTRSIKSHIGSVMIGII